MSTGQPSKLSAYARRVLWRTYRRVIGALLAAGAVTGAIVFASLYFLLPHDDGEGGIAVLGIMTAWGAMIGAGNGLTAAAGVALSALAWGRREQWPLAVRALAAALGAGIGAAALWLGILLGRIVTAAPGMMTGSIAAGLASAFVPLAVGAGVIAAAVAGIATARAIRRDGPAAAAS